MFKTGLSFATALSLLSLLILAATSGRGAAITPAPMPASEVKSDGVMLVSREVPVDVGVFGNLVAEVPRVTSRSQLEQSLASTVNVMVVDRSAASDFEGSDLLYQQLKQGRALMGINVSLEELRRLSRYEQAVREAKADPNKGPQVLPAPGVPEQPFYSMVAVSRPGTVVTRFGDGQKYFVDRLFKADLAQRSHGIYANLPGN